MRLDLIRPWNSQITYKHTKFPDGQRAIEIVRWNSSVLCKDVKVIARFSHFSDFELIADAVAAVRRMNKTVNIHLFLPYIIGSRSDRQFSIGSSSYFVDVIAPMINSLKAKTVTSITPHSDVMAACIKNFEGEEPFAFLTTDLIRNYKWICPDAGAQKRIYALAKHYKKPIKDIIFCSKHRTDDGKIETDIPFFEGQSNPGNKYLIIDDLCDGGGTFLGIVGKFKTKGLIWENMSLMVTHGIFSKGLDVLAKAFDSIYVTNSYQSYDEISEFGKNNKEKLSLLNVKNL